jgi:hydrogenase expression/formation protein HypC
MCLGIPTKLVEINETEDFYFRTGKVLFGGISLNISLAMLPEAKIGDYILVHAGIAISVMDEAEAQTTFDYLKKTDELDELIKLQDDDK